MSTIRTWTGCRRVTRRVQETEFGARRFFIVAERIDRTIAGRNVFRDTWCGNALVDSKEAVFCERTTQ